MVYLPPAFTESLEEVLVAFIEQHDFGTIVSQSERGMIASQIPFLIERRADRVFLLGHIARANPQGADLLPGGEVMVLFQGPHTYISPSWYQAGPAVPTWNYATVHAYGTPRTVDHAGWLRDVLQRLSERHEGREPAPPWRMQDQPEPYLAGMLKGIIGFEIAVERLEGKFKLSQNRPAGDRPRIIAALEAREDADSHDVARLMREREPGG
ncbi:MAG: FMN-binding negative transcriptional regulator [Alphaproteobacteria bacterium]|nr:FMN-binding negative transcriptional regulator [Alphaproteobacteria bacterium]